MLSDDLPASSNNMHLILSQEARIALKAGALAPVLLSSCLVKNLLSHHWLCLYQHLGVYQQLDSPALQLEFFCLLRRNLATPRLRSPCYCE